MWSNSGTARIGFQPVKVWQFWQGTAKAPCGLRVFCACVPGCGGDGGAGAHASVRNNTKRTVIAETMVFAFDGPDSYQSVSL